MAADVDPAVAARVAHLHGVTVERFFTEGVEEPPPLEVPPVPGVRSGDLETEDGVRVRRYEPDRAADGARPCLVWCHGGGWAFGHLDMPEAHVVAQQVVAALDAVVYSVDYRLGAEHPYPLPQEDLESAFGHALGDPDVDPTRIAIGGASAGGHLAACVAPLLVDADAPLAAVWLAYPVLDPLGGPYPGDRPESCPDLVWFDGPKTAAMFASHAGTTPPPAGSVPADLDPTGLPATLVSTAAVDALAPQAAAHVVRLEDAGVDVEHHQIDRVLHGYLDLCGAIEVADAALARHLRWLAAHLR